MQAWKLVVTPKMSGAENMRLDLEMFNAFEQGVGGPCLRIYSWEPKCISYGYAQEIAGLIDLKRAGELGWDVVRRPTGGGIVFHNRAEVTYSLLTAIDDPKLPQGMIPAYKRISEAVVAGLGELGMQAGIRKQKAESRKPLGFARGKQNTGLCFSYPAEYEVVVKDRKIVGGAQKRGRKALLQQGSIFVKETAEQDLALLKEKKLRHDAVSVEQVLGRKVGFEELSGALRRGFEEGLGVSFEG